MRPAARPCVHCKQLFTPISPELIYCYTCRGQRLGLEQKNLGKPMHDEAVRTTAYYYTSLRALFDWRINDENGVEVWALDLAKRYRGETAPRGLRRSSRR